MSKNSASFWRAARNNLGMPECPADVSEPQYADLVFFRGCYVRLRTVRRILIEVIHTFSTRSVEPLPLELSASLLVYECAPNASKNSAFSVRFFQYMLICALSFQREIDLLCDDRNWGTALTTLSGFDDRMQVLDCLPSHHKAGRGKCECDFVLQVCWVIT